ncbi:MULTISPECIES: ABC transporter ATP-binding protein [unclassified Apibacter]|uniref:ABC transporter ATP-binding protein n=1 Tax=unclassified Apibacter TaxID=2630820 RepID=UPI0013267174|nr:MULTISPECIES: ABC transporter ATP-binding protein [unclassified Apibacter]MCX8677712.1 ATP-binding cassette domain-containing protein [Apibacter sp. B3919]MXO24988.1 ATP-binding cassette domain-containing protein [Apibacter sp. B3924]MXO27261.1 ATP-binding cassette domain-containing protein [Apibacter sp. B3813]MXO29074.1 ATP-binding cassette domain-containing protein [Apibacter sp. B3913]MXO31145.1 ATP-binding cassette domain-containing protein [Apibacter sp. B3912]
MNLAIKIENISKLYRLGQVGTGTLQQDLKRWWWKTMGKGDPFAKIGETNDRTTKGSSDYVWALKEVSFDVKQGEVLGIIGRNGAGKSTLLKILSKTTSPTSGCIKINGRIASLLEVGTGFHPELTGRENIFLNGAILGMTKREIRSKFDEIVNFSGVERYIDTPVKRYSSGMYVRLAFAVAAHLEPDILIVDEVLAVGDAEFQKKCLGKMKDVSINDGRTVLFVSHNMAAIRTLCNQGVVMQHGGVSYIGGALESVEYYQKLTNISSFLEHKGDIETAPGNENIKILKFNTQPINGSYLTISSGVQFELVFYNNKVGINLDATFELRNSDEITIFHTGELITKNKDSKRGIYKVTGQIDPNFLNAGVYKFNLIFGEDQRYPLYIQNEVIQFEIINESLGFNSNLLPGVLRPDLNFSNKFYG